MRVFTGHGDSGGQRNGGLGRQDAECGEDGAIAIYGDLDETAGPVSRDCPAREYRSAAVILKSSAGFSTMATQSRESSTARRGMRWLFHGTVRKRTQIAASQPRKQPSPN